jgi:Xaa-Pro dipeptidase
VVGDRRSRAGGGARAAPRARGRAARLPRAPGDAPTSHLAPLEALLERLPAGAPIAIDRERLPLALAAWIERGGRPLVPFDDVLRELRIVKRADELAAIRAAGEIVNRGVAASIAACRPGVSELEIDAAGARAIHERVAQLDADTTLELLVMSPSGERRSILPHVSSSSRRLAPGDVLIHTRQVALDGYRAELERTLVVGEPSAEQARAFAGMQDAQQAAIDAVGPGVAASAVDAAARAVIDQAGFGAFAVHRTGHGIGISVHGHPHLRFDSDELLAPGMAVTIEPGFYVPGLGGFRHSDTLLVTDDGSELVTEHPRELSALTVT